MNDILLRLLNRFGKLDKKSIVFSCLNYRYDDSPTFICEKIHELAPDIKLVWILRDANYISLPKYITALEEGSKDSIKAIYKSIAVIGNGFGSITAFKKKSIGSKAIYYIKRILLRRDQYYFCTWHGTPIKKIGRDDDGSIIGFYVANGVLYQENTFTCEILKRCTFGQFKTKLLGQPRNDHLKHINTNEVYNIKTKIGIQNNKKIIIYAPTFRNNMRLTKEENIFNSGIMQLELIDFHKLFLTLSYKFGGEWVFIARFHNIVEKNINWGKLKKKYGDNIVNGNILPDMADYLLCADALITDISSTIFDFLHTNKPSFLFFPDKNIYERELYFDLEKMPFPLSTNFGKLIQDIECFNREKYDRGLKILKKRIGYIDIDNSAKLIADDILETIGYKKEENKW